MGSLDRWIGIVALILGIPGFLLLFLTKDYAVALLIVGIGVLLFGAAYLINRAGKLPPFRMKSVRVDLRLIDVLGNEATLRKEYEVIPSYAHLTAMSHRNIAADGAITNLQWNDTPIDPSWIEQVLGEYQITAKFPGPLPKGKLFKCALSYNADGSFLQTEEGLVYVVDFPAKTVTISIRFPEDRMCTDAWCFRVQGAGKVPLPKPQVNATQKTLQVKLKRPQVGAEIEIKWHW
jgi:hypothetical protein